MEYSEATDCIVVGFPRLTLKLQVRGSGKQPRETVFNVLEAAIVNVWKIFDANTFENFTLCATRLGKAWCSFFAKRRSCFSIGFYFRYVHGMFRINSLLKIGFGSKFANRMRDFVAGDVLLAISFDLYSAKTFQAVKALVALILPYFGERALAAITPNRRIKLGELSS